MRKLGEVQRGVLESLERYQGWYVGCGWLWKNRSTTIRTLRGLKIRGLVSSRFTGWGTTLYEITDAGRAAIEPAWKKKLRRSR